MSTVLPERAARPAPGVWPLRILCLSLLAVAAIVVGSAATSIARSSGDVGGRASVAGVRMPDDTTFRAVTGRLVARHRPVWLASVRVRGDGGRITVERAVAGRPRFPSSYLNPGVLPVLARATGAASDDPIVVRELRLTVSPSTGRQRWSLSGTQDGRPWRATVNPNGTDLRRTRPAASAAR